MELRPQKTIIIQGLHTLYLRGMRSLVDLKVFLSPHELVRLAWKLHRDVSERGQSPEHVINNMIKREWDSKMHIEPQRNEADWIIEYIPTEEISKEDVIAKKPFELAMRYTLWNDAPVSELFDELVKSKACDIQFKMFPNDINRVMVEFRGNPESSVIEGVAEKIFSNLRHITRGWRVPRWRSGLDGITQLTTLSLLNGKLREQSG